MAAIETRIATRERLWRLALALLPGLALVLLRGVDANWDLRNYHLYGPHAWWTGRMAIDIAPAQLQTWHNPLLDLSLYWLVMSGWDLRWSSVWLTLPFATAIYVLLGLQARLSPAPPTRGAQIVLALLAMSGATVWATFGNSMNDGFVAAALLTALTLVLDPDGAPPRRWLWAGLIAGAMLGLKLTASSYCLALAAAALLATPGPWRMRSTRVLALAVGGLLGFLITYGWWGWKLQELFGNPFFPYYNNVFGSPWAPLRDFADARFRADGLGDALTIPLQLLRDDTARSELYVRDPRLLFGALGLPALAWWLRRRSAAALSSQARLLAVFFWTALLAWALQYGIYRYVALLELLGVLALVLWLARIPRWRGVVLFLAVVLVSKATHRPDWGHARVSDPAALLAPVLLPAGSMVVIASNEPLAWMALRLDRSVPLVAVQNNLMAPGSTHGLQARAASRIAGQQGPLWSLDAGPSDASGLQVLRLHHSIQRAGPCRLVGSALGTARLCPLRRTDAGPGTVRPGPAPL